MEHYKYLLLIIYIIFLSSIIKCELISKNQLDLLINSYQNNVLKNFEEILELKENGTVWNYNILFNLKKFSMNMDKKRIEKIIEILKQPRENFPYKIDESKLVKEANDRERSFLMKYETILHTMKETNNLYLKTVHMIKTAIIIFICFILFVTLLVLAIMVYITKPKWNNYETLNENEKEKDKDKNSNDSTTFKVVNILNNFVKSEKKLK